MQYPPVIAVTVAGADEPPPAVTGVTVTAWDAGTMRPVSGDGAAERLNTAHARADTVAQRNHEGAKDKPPSQGITAV